MTLSTIIFIVGVLLALKDGSVSDNGSLPSFKIFLPYIHGEKKLWDEPDTWTFIMVLGMALVAGTYVPTRALMHMFEKHKQ